MATTTCLRCHQTRDSVPFKPFQNELGQRILDGICNVCWSEWLKLQQQLINHYGLNVMDPEARTFLTRNLQGFLFKAGGTEQVDTTQKGTINW